jgi:hypothetical protein
MLAQAVLALALVLSGIFGRVGGYAMLLKSPVMLRSLARSCMVRQRRRTPTQNFSSLEPSRDGQPGPLPPH